MIKVCQPARFPGQALNEANLVDEVTLCCPHPLTALRVPT
jgi:hypothetical protein